MTGPQGHARAPARALAPYVREADISPPPPICSDKYYE